MSTNNAHHPSHEHRTEAQIRVGALHCYDCRGLTKDEVVEVSENINRLNRLRSSAKNDQ